jgi:hypothetical protein
MYEQHEWYFVLIILTANRRGEHERLSNDKNKSRFCPLYHLSLALIGTILRSFYDDAYFF